jgi:hypothetical protein
MVRAKFRVNNVSKQSWGTEVELHPVYGESPENKSLFAATGRIRITVANETAAQAFEVNKEYYVDITPAT